MRFTYIRTTLVLTIVLLLSGCLYPKSELAQNKVPNEDQLELVQSAVLKYQENTNGLMPIKTKPADTPVFEKYLIDFSAMKENNVLTEIPGNAFENGGIYQYTLITPEENPRVKLIDLRITEELRSINIKVDAYRSKNIYPPFGQKIDEGIFMINHELLGLAAEPYIVSPYSNKNLPIIMDTDGQLYVDYRIDLFDALKTYDHQYEEGEDIRYLLADHTPFVPAYSLPYSVHEDEPVFLLK